MEKNAIPDDGLLQTTEFKAYDNVIAVALFLCFLIGLPGNCLALKYFIQNKKRNLSNCLYIIACCIDVCSSIIALPAAAGLWNGRNPGILGTPIICTAWYYSLMMLQLTSMFVVMLPTVCVPCYCHCVSLLQGQQACSSLVYFRLCCVPVCMEHMQVF